MHTRHVPFLVLSLCLAVIAVEMAWLTSSKRLMFGVPAMTNEKLGDESQILVFGKDLAKNLVEERVVSQLDVFLVLSMILCPVVLCDLVEMRPIGEWLVDQTMSAHGTQRQ